VIQTAHNNNVCVVGSAVCDAVFREQLDQSFSSAFRFVISKYTHLCHNNRRAHPVFPTHAHMHEKNTLKSFLEL